MTPRSANYEQVAVYEHDTSYSRELNARISELIVALYQQKLTYGEFASKRYWMSSQAVAAELQYRQSIIEKDRQRQFQAQQGFANTLTAWANYMQAVNARQPQTVFINGTIQVHSN